ncbi:MAG: ABC transporter substrate-binding protein [Deltaproteobacteria bacterium]|nr:ABC transporter substrate-binding protein [Deltaproteobacteria bacterium]
MADTSAAVEALKEAGAGDRIVYNQTFLSDQTDYRTAIAAIKAKKADAVVLVLFPGALSSFFKQARQLKLEAEITGMETFEDEAEVKAAGGAMENAWYVNASDPSDQFAAEFAAKYGLQPGWAAANACDSVSLLADAVAHAGPNRDKVRDFLATVKDYGGAAGTYSASGDNRFLLPAALKRVEAGKFIKIGASN